MTREQIEHHIAELNRTLLEDVLPYPQGGTDKQLRKWREHHDRFRGDIEMLEFLLARLPVAPTKVASERIRKARLHPAAM
jgi:hypothetical protein